MSLPDPVPESENLGPRPSRRIFLGFLAYIAGLYAIILALNFLIPRPALPGSSLFEACREFCQSYGLVPTGHLANDATALLDAVGTRTLTASLAEILNDTTFTPANSESHPLLGKLAPEFRLTDDRGESVALNQFKGRGPIVLVFYYGYGCSHCVAQLFALQKDLKLFRELGAQIVAVSPDTSEHTADRFQEYGRFDFPCLSDADDTVSELYQVYARRTDHTPESRRHGTFLIDPSGRVVFAARGNQPFLDNKSLLIRIARDCLPPQQSTAPGDSKTPPAISSR